MNFFKEKTEVLQKHDLSRKGSIDSPIHDLVNFINSLNSYFTTSSCSGRTIVFSNTGSKKKGCNWIFVSHDIISVNEITKHLESHSGSAILKFEPFVLHTQCLTIEDAQILLRVGVQAGFKNSGISIGKSGKIIVALRSTLSLEVPLSSEGSLLVSDEYIQFIVNICNEKMLSNWDRIERFYSNLQSSNDILKERNPPINDSKIKSDENVKPAFDKILDSLEDTLHENDQAPLKNKKIVFKYTSMDDAHKENNPSSNDTKIKSNKNVKPACDKILDSLEDTLCEGFLCLYNDNDQTKW